MKSIVLPAGTEHVLFGDLAHLIADALWPDAGANDDRMTYACARINFDGELARAVKCGALPVKDPLTSAPHTFPIGDALNRAVVLVDDLREFVAGRGVTVIVDTAPEQSPTTPAPMMTAKAGPVEPAKAGPVPVTTRAMADSFAGLHWGGEQWIKKLGDKPVWLDGCIVLNRGRGEGSRQWNPVLIGAYLARMGHVKPKSIRAKFQTQPALKPWLEEWKAYEADNYPTD